MQEETAALPKHHTDVLCLVKETSPAIPNVLQLLI
jgi:hypothetical protein